MGKRRDYKKIRKIGVLVLLVLVALGFTLPGFIDKDTQTFAESRICRNDADCYLMCEEVPVKVLCSANQCMINSCQEESFYPYQEQALTFTLSVEIDKEKLALSGLTSPSNLFVKFAEDKVNLHSSGIALRQVLEKAQVSFNYQCLVYNSTQYCASGEEGLQMFVNGEPSYAYSDYVPEEGDVVELVYE